MPRTGKNLLEKIPLLLEVLGERNKGTYKEIARGIWENILRMGYSFSSNKGVRIVEEDWDYLIILDACRYDYFKKFHSFNCGRLEKRLSLASDTVEWFKKNFRDYVNISYVSSNPQVSEFILNKEIGFVPFENLISVWKENWNERINTVFPEKVSQAALSWIKQNPDKRTIVHYIQPHAPFIFGPRIGRGMKRSKYLAEGKKPPRGNIIFRLMKRGLPMEEVKRGYIKNLIYVLREVKELIQHLEGKIVITADHGNCFGEYGIYGHPPEIHLKELVEIPWFVLKKREAKEIKGDVESHNESEETVEEEEIKRKLRSLGYTQ